MLFVTIGLIFGNPITYTQYCDSSLLKASLCKQYRGNISSRFFNTSETFASESLENHEEMFLSYW